MNLGIAFTGLDRIEDDLYPLVCSPSIRTRMTLGLRLRGYRNLQDRCRAAIADGVRKIDRVEGLPLPKRVKSYVEESFPVQQQSCLEGILEEGEKPSYIPIYARYSSP